MSKKYKVSVQGMKRDLQTANGDYDTIDLGMMDEDDLYESLRKFKSVQELIPKKNEDLCPPALYVSGEKNEYNFYLSNGEIVCGNTDLPVSPLEAVNLIKGIVDKNEAAQKAVDASKAKPDSPKSKKGKKALAWGSEHPDVKGMMPVRRAELAPTDKEEISRFNVSTAQSNPHIALQAYKGSGYEAAIQVFLAFGLLGLILGLPLLFMDSVGAGFVFILVAFLLLWLRKKIKTSWGATLLRIGFDWKNNALWIKKDSDKEAQMVANANCISDFTLAEHKSTRQGRVHFDQDFTKSGTKVQYTDKSWMLLAQMSNNTNKLVAVFTEKKRGEEALEKMKALLHQQ
jgi:hypothetical protein